MSIQLSLALKEATRSVHQSLEGIVVRKLKAISTRDEYAQLLSAFYGFHHPAEHKLDAWLDDSLIPYYTGRRRSSAILDDLRELGEDIHIPLAMDLPQIDSLAKALGVFYVLEGSTMGGKIIAGMLRRQGIPGDAIRFFNAYRENELPMWQAFTSVLDHFPVDPLFNDEIREAAITTFEKFRNWMITHQVAGMSFSAPVPRNS